MGPQPAACHSPTAVCVCARVCVFKKGALDICLETQVWNLSKKEQDFSQTSCLSYKPSGPLGRARFSLRAHAKRPQTQTCTDLKSVTCLATVHSSPLGALITRALVHRSRVHAAATAFLPRKVKESLQAADLCTYFLKIRDLNTMKSSVWREGGFQEPRGRNSAAEIYICH